MNPEPAEPAIKPPPPRPWRRAWRGLRLALVAYLLLVLLVSWFQTYLIFPGQLRRGRPSTRVDPRPGTELLSLATSRGDRVVALFGPALDPAGRPRPDASTCPTLLFFYGNGSSLRSSLEHFDGFRKLGANVLIPDYVGYGMSDGSPSEAACYATADASYDYLLGRSDVDPSRIVATGWSLGGAVAIDLASRRQVAGLIVFDTFTRMVEMAELRYPWLPARWLLRHRFESLDKIARVTAPALFVHGTADRLIPPAMSDRLADAAAGPAARFDVPGAGHNDLFGIGGPRLAARIDRFLDTLR